MKTNGSVNEKLDAYKVPVHHKYLATIRPVVLKVYYLVSCISFIWELYLGTISPGQSECKSLRTFVLDLLRADEEGAGQIW